MQLYLYNIIPLGITGITVIFPFLGDRQTYRIHPAILRCGWGRKWPKPGSDMCDVPWWEGVALYIYIILYRYTRGCCENSLLRDSLFDGWAADAAPAFSLALSLLDLGSIRVGGQPLAPFSLPLLPLFLSLVLVLVLSLICGLIDSMSCCCCFGCLIWILILWQVVVVVFVFYCTCKTKD